MNHLDFAKHMLIFFSLKMSSCQKQGKKIIILFIFSLTMSVIISTF